MAKDDGGFREFVDLRYGELLRIAYLLTGSPHDAEDLVQSALLKVMRRWRKVDDPVAYLRRTMANQHSYLDDRPEAEVAALLGWPVGTPKGR